MQKILIVDDQQDVLRLLSKRLEKNGFTTIVSSKGLDCLDLAREHNPDAILLDIMMPDIDGLEVCKTLRNDPKTSAIPIILISGRILPQDVRAGFDAGASDYIKKPIEQIELIERVRSAINQMSERAAAVEAESGKTFIATVVAANHKLKQPLTVINLAVTSIKRAFQKGELDAETLNQKLETITMAVNQMSAILDSLSNISKPEFEKYIRDITMITVDGKL